MLNDIEIAEKAKLRKISDVAKDRLGISEDEIEAYGRYKAKVSLSCLDKLKNKKDGKLILVTAISPTPAGEGKTTTTVGLGDAFIRSCIWNERWRNRRRICSNSSYGRY